MELKRLRDYRATVTSQDGEDGILAELFRRIGTHNKWCVEFGALNGTHDSNTWTLLMNDGWSGVFIEADRTYFEKLVEVYKDVPRAHCFNEFVSYEGEHSLDSIFARSTIPADFDLLSIDIDGSDYHVWESLRNYRPRVVVIEINPTIPSDVEFVQPRDMTVFQGSSLLSLIQLGKEKGYELVETNETNAFFVLRELLPLTGVKDISIEALRDDHRFETKLFQLYDGTLVLSGYDRLFWHNIPIDQEKIQVLPKHKRIYPARIHEDTGTRSFKYFVRKLPIYPLVQKLRKLF